VPFLCFGLIACTMDAGGDSGRGLSGTSWQVRSYNDGSQGVATLIRGTRINADFGKDGRVTGNAGCNGYFAHYDTADDTIRVELPAATRKYCVTPTGLMDQERFYLQALHSATAFRIEGDELTLRRADGAQAVLLVRDRSAAAVPASAAKAKILFDLDSLDSEGLRGPRDGLRALHYEYCIPDRPELVREATAIDPTLEIQHGSPGRSGCAQDALLCLGHTHQPDFRSVLNRLAGMAAIAEIRESFFE